MRFPCCSVAVFLLAACMAAPSASAAIVIDFQDLGGAFTDEKGNFFAEEDASFDPDRAGLGIAGTPPGQSDPTPGSGPYRDFFWGFSDGGTPFSVPTNAENGIGFAVDQSGSNIFAYNYRNPQSLVIDFRMPVAAVTAASFAQYSTSPDTESPNSATGVSLYGYADLADSIPEAMTDRIILGSSFSETELENFTDIRYFEIRVDNVPTGGGDGTPEGSFFAVDDIRVTAVPEPSSLALLGLVAVGGVVRHRRRSRS